MLAHAAAPLWWLPQAALLAWAVARLQAGGGVAQVLALAAGIVALGAARALTEAWAGARLFDQARAQLSAWRAEAVQAWAARSPLDSRRVAAGQAASVLAEQADAVLPWLTRYRAAQWRVRLVPPLLLLPVAGQSWAAAGVLLAAAPLIPLFMAIVGWRAKAASEAQWAQMGDLHADLLDRLRGLPTLRALGAVAGSAHRLRRQAERLRRRTMRVLRIAFLSSAVLELFSALGVAIVAVYIGFHLLGVLDFGAWGRKLNLAEALFVLLLAPAFFEPLRELAAVWHDRASGEAALQALEGVRTGALALPGHAQAAQESAHRSTSMPPVAPRPAPAVRVRGLGFGFAGRPPLYQGLDLDVRPGEAVALVGGSGSGKTVLLALLAGLVPPTQGHIEIDGVPLAGDALPRLRARMAWMGQRPHVFARSVTRNVSLYRAGVSDEQVARATRLAGLAGVAQAHPGVLLGEGGTGLSGGEGARLALARLAAVPGADLLLLDEPTAHLDRETAAQITEAILMLAQGRTLIVATHDPELAARMDRVWTLPLPPSPMARRATAQSLSPRHTFEDLVA